jgi:hypothetical protein
MKSCSHIRFAKPLFLWLLAALLLWVRVRSRLLVILARTGIFVVDSGLAALVVARQHAEASFAFDISQSVTTGMRRWMEATAEGRLAPNHGIACRFRL